MKPTIDLTHDCHASPRYVIAFSKAKRPKYEFTGWNVYDRHVSNGFETGRLAGLCQRIQGFETEAEAREYADSRNAS